MNQSSSGLGINQIIFVKLKGKSNLSLSIQNYLAFQKTKLIKLSFSYIILLLSNGAENF